MYSTSDVFILDNYQTVIYTLKLLQVSAKLHEIVPVTESLRIMHFRNMMRLSGTTYSHVSWFYWLTLLLVLENNIFL